MRFLLMFFIGLVCFHSSLFANEQQLRDEPLEFIQKFETYKFPQFKRESVRFSKASPWYGYLEQPFDFGLSKSQREQYLRFQNEGQCLNVLEFDLLGFLQNHSHLVGVFENYKPVRQQFLSQVGPLFSRGHARCLALARLKRNDFFKSQKAQPMMIEVETNKSRKPSVSNERKKILKVSLQEIFETALCQDYLPAQMDIIRWKVQKLPFDFSDETFFYLFKRAEKQGGKTQLTSFSGIIESVGQKTSYQSVIVEAAFEGQIKNLEYAMPFWFQRCSQKLH